MAHSWQLEGQHACQQASERSSGMVFICPMVAASNNVQACNTGLCNSSLCTAPQGAVLWPFTRNNAPLRHQCCWLVHPRRAVLPAPGESPRGDNTPASHLGWHSANTPLARRPCRSPTVGRQWLQPGRYGYCSRPSRAHDYAFDGVAGHLGTCCLGQLAEALAIPPARRTKANSRAYGKPPPGSFCTTSC